MAKETVGQEETLYKRISEEEEIYVINADRCTECVGNFESPKCAEVCPVDACVLDTGHEESKEQLLEKWRSLHPGETPVFEP